MRKNQPWEKRKTSQAEGTAQATALGEGHAELSGSQRKSSGLEPCKQEELKMEMKAREWTETRLGRTLESKVRYLDVTLSTG